MNKDQYVIGVDYGTDSVRSVIVDTRNGKELASSVFMYPALAAGLILRCRRKPFPSAPAGLCGRVGIYHYGLP